MTNRDSARPPRDAGIAGREAVANAARLRYRSPERRVIVDFVALDRWPSGLRHRSWNSTPTILTRIKVCRIAADLRAFVGSQTFFVMFRKSPC
jgi:hypothetical protein